MRATVLRAVELSAQNAQSQSTSASQRRQRSRDTTLRCYVALLTNSDAVKPLLNRSKVRQEQQRENEREKEKESKGE